MNHNVFSRVCQHAHTHILLKTFRIIITIMAKANLMERRLTSDLFIDYENKEIKNIYDNVKNAQHVYSMVMREHYYDKVKYMSYIQCQRL